MLLDEGERIAIGLNNYVRKYNGQYWIESEIKGDQWRRVISYELALTLVNELGMTYDEDLWLQYDYNDDIILWEE